MGGSSLDINSDKERSWMERGASRASHRRIYPMRGFMPTAPQNMAMSEMRYKVVGFDRGGLGGGGYTTVGEAEERIRGSEIT